ncbi:hypothetical protein GUJ93_ZPchr0006g41692 [Zizania palustris]|uniref:Protein phosphatase n=1 Tax=Zizania palustris TaxID=103762 RepID=A0A8J5SFV0_ZIZPA|nr:hypothetical protein GUJ93_ZPchr0006g41692 [Zizania palustris]
MESLEQIKETVSAIDDKIPDVVRAALRLEHHYQTVKREHDDDIKSLAASLLRRPGEPGEEGDEDDEPGSPAPSQLQRRRWFSELRQRSLAEWEQGTWSPEREGGEDGRLPTAEDDLEGGEDGCDPTDCDGDLQALRIDWASCYVPLHDEDAHFGHGGAGVVGVADGVGGYRDDGVDAGEFSRGLMTSAFAQLVNAERAAPVCPYTLMKRAYKKTVASGAHGASTAIIVSLAGNVLKWAYIGDSVFALLRDGVIVERSQPQQMSFNCPFQLRRGGGQKISMANVGEVEVRHGDVVVVGTDGLFDNMFYHELEKVVQIGASQCFSAKNMADIIVGTVYEMSCCRVRDSPFAAQSWKHSRRHRGGKRDDITVIVAFIVSSDS